MPSPFIDTPQALNEAIAASRTTRREKLKRAMRNQGIRTRAAFVLAGCIAPFALVAFAAGDREAAKFIVAISCTTITLTFIAGKAGRKKAVDALREMDQST
jgi:hypothetical protein